MPAPRSRSKRYSSEYKSHYKKFSSKRPITVKGEVTRSFSPVDLHVRSIDSTPRAGLQSTHLGVIHEPPLQRKRIVAYEKNHNIFPTGTVKEIPERIWLSVDGASSVSSYNSPAPARKNHSVIKLNGNHTKPKRQTNDRGETPIIAAERKMLGTSSPERVSHYPYVSDRIKRKSTYSQDFAVTSRKTKGHQGKRKDISPIRKTKVEVGGNKSGVSPDRLPAAGVRTTTSIGDKRLTKPSDNSQYLRSPERQDNKVRDSEYRSRFKLIDGTWIESPELQERPSPVNESTKNLEWYKEALKRRNEAYGYAHRERGTHFSREELNRQNHLQAYYNDHDDSFSTASESQHSVENSPNKEREKKKNIENKRRTEHDRPPPPRREAWVNRPPSPIGSIDTHTTFDTETTITGDGPCFLERGRSPTPELRDAGQFRRHHYDVTTDVLNDRLQKSLTFSDKKKQSPKKTLNGHIRDDRKEAVGFKEHQHGERPLSPASSTARSDAGSYVPPQDGHRKIQRDDDVMSEASMSSRASVASGTLDKARKRRDEFWAKQNYSKTH